MNVPLARELEAGIEERTTGWLLDVLRSCARELARRALRR